jgi:MOSC domain-containing protein YiiM
MEATVINVARSRSHTFSKAAEPAIMLIAGIGVEGDAHAGETVKHRSRVRANPNQPNLRQVHLIHSELHDELRDCGFYVKPGDMGENVTTRGVDLLKLGTGTRLRIGEALIEITGLRNPCVQLDRFQDGLMSAVLDRDAAGNLIRKAGVMAVVIEGGRVLRGDAVTIDTVPESHRPLAPV